MGQQASKKYGSLTFGYVAHTAVPDRDTPPRNDPFSNTDLLFTRPELYGLLEPWQICDEPEIESANNCPDTSFRRADSGYCTNSSHKQLPVTLTTIMAAELAYIDTTYYLDFLTSFTPPKETEHANNNDKDQLKRITVADVISANFQEIVYSSRQLTTLTNNFRLLIGLRKLDLSKNRLSRLPESIGHLTQLRVLLLHHNELIEVPDTLSLLTQLMELDLEHNKLTYLTPFIGRLKNLKILNVAHNRLVELPVQVAGLVQLEQLNVSHNHQLKTLPAEILQLPSLLRLRHDECHGLSLQETEMPVSVTPLPSLKELCARTIVMNSKNIDPAVLPSHLVPYLDSAKPCTACGQPYIETYVSRRRFVAKSDGLVPVEYRLCRSHWVDDEDRILYTFSQPPKSDAVKDYPRNLPTLSRDDKSSVAYHGMAPPSSPTPTSGSTGSATNGTANVINVCEDKKPPLFSSWRPQRLIRVMNRNHSGFLSAKSRLKRTGSPSNSHTSS